MRLPVPFIQLPIRFDAAALAAEIGAIEPGAWRGRTAVEDGNSALVLISTEGDPASDHLSGRMRPTPWLERCPYLMQVLEALGATLGRARLMRLNGQAEVRAHVDVNYYWRERMRVHVPVTTTPDVRFQCGEAEVHMGRGECWIFDTWRRHRVLNAGSAERIHLVVDTIGGAGLWDLIARGRMHGRPEPAGWHPADLRPRKNPASPVLEFERYNAPVVMSPWEMKETFVFLLGEVLPHPALDGVQASLLQLARRWQALWALFGEQTDGWSRYRALLDAAWAELEMRGIGQIGLRNEIGLQAAIKAQVFDVALRDRAHDAAVDRHGEYNDAMSAAGTAGSAARSVSPAGDFDRPVFIVSPPRSGSTLLFETLAGAAGVHTIGGESHGLIEGIAALDPRRRGFDSNRLLAEEAAPEVTAALRAAFLSQLRDRDGCPADRSVPVRLLEKTPKNALRIPFLRAAFPGARFIYLHRDPRQVWSSMIEGWQSGRFRTYADLPGWHGLPWSFLLVPGWRELDGMALPDLVAQQWRRCCEILLDDLDALAREDWIAVDYARFLDAPQLEIERLSRWAGFAWDRRLGADLPLSRHTVTRPDPEKWRRHAAEIEPRLVLHADLVARARCAEKY